MNDGTAPFPAEDLSGTDDDASVDQAVAVCSVFDVEIGMFFDGTGNNLANVTEGNRIRAEGDDPHPEDSYNNDLSNVAKLYQLFDAGESRSGSGAPCKLRSKDIIDGIGTTSGGDDSLVGFGVAWGPSGTEERAKEGFLAFLQHIRSANSRGEVNTIKLDVFGFSRGAAAARHFINCVHRGHAGHGYGGSAYELQDEDRAKLEIRFVGLFDTVVSWGLVADDANHGSLRIGLLDSSATQIVHLTALDEFRKNFPLTAAPGGAETLPVPGAHADVGGGYPDHWVERPQVARTETNTRGGRPSSAAQIAEIEGRGHEDEVLWLKLVADGWLRPTDRAALQRDVDPGGGGRNPWHIRRYKHRPWLNHRLSHVALHVMHARAYDAGVALPATLPGNADYAVPGALQGITARLIAGEQMTTADSKPFRRDFVHHSANWARSGPFIPMMPREGNTRRVFPNPSGEAVTPR